MITLAIDGYLRHGGSPETLLKDLCAKQAINLARDWPPPGEADAPVQHDRSGEPT
ncbi:dATP/dGTP pyrophosphohydrolase domain-containing protein [Methylobrevis pamukkalensis]|uniref:dATP/dGTP diphosphohydrolase MazZ domain-containing protein n=1 Tax=Methylobrevis pamukkalensis TaxID=1439726 RepID=A0A1E3H5Q2_9HYPH|nr:dATP/dGTP pyrophosphohydrolase domain-containing protein [Methylobrevis pamukkalensis]ODN71647.1 hypothetical protein A6302_00984 [Methylobrevis pamukkalensis]